MTNAYQLVEQGRRLLAGNRPDLAVKVFREALSQEPEHAEAHALYAAALLNSGDLAQAKREAEIALGLQPGDAYTRYVMTCVLCHEGNFKKALVHVQQALQTNPEDELAHEKLVDILRRQGKRRKAIEACVAALKLYPLNVTLLNLRGLLEKEGGDKTASEATIHELLALAPEDPDGLSSLGYLHLERGELEAAMACFRAALRVKPDYERARLGILETLKASNWIFAKFLGGTNLRAMSIRLWFGFILVFIVTLIGSRFSSRIDERLYMAVLFISTLFPVAVAAGIPLGNLLLFTHPVGRMTLSDDERKIVIMSLLMLCGMAIFVGVASLFTPNGILGVR